MVWGSVLLGVCRGVPPLLASRSLPGPSRMDSGSLRTKLQRRDAGVGCGEIVHVSTVKGSGPRDRALTAFATVRFRHVWSIYQLPVTGRGGTMEAKPCLAQSRIMKNSPTPNVKSIPRDEHFSSPSFDRWGN